MEGFTGPDGNEGGFEEKSLWGNYHSSCELPPQLLLVSAPGGSDDALLRFTGTMSYLLTETRRCRLR